MKTKALQVPGFAGASFLKDMKRIKNNLCGAVVRHTDISWSLMAVVAQVKCQLKLQVTFSNGLVFVSQRSWLRMNEIILKGH